MSQPRGIAPDAANLRRQMNLRGLTVHRLAEASGLSYQVIRKALAGLPVEPATLAGIALVFDQISPSPALDDLLPS